MSSPARKASENGTRAAAARAPGAGASADPHYERRWLIPLVVLIAQVMILLEESGRAVSPFRLDYVAF